MNSNDLALCVIFGIVAGYFYIAGICGMVDWLMKSLEKRDMVTSPCRRFMWSIPCVLAALLWPVGLAVGLTVLPLVPFGFIIERLVNPRPKEKSASEDVERNESSNIELELASPLPVHDRQASTHHANAPSPKDLPPSYTPNI